MLTTWPSNSQRTSGKQSHKLCWSLFPIRFSSVESCFQGQPVNLLIQLSRLLSWSVKSSHTGPILGSLVSDFGGLPSSTALVFKSTHSTENDDKAFPANGCPWILSLSLLHLYLSCTPLLFWVRVAILWRFLLLSELSGLILCANLNPTPLKFWL